MPTPDFIFHVTERSRWESQKQSGFYIDPSLEAEGFIHCSGSEAQLKGVLERYFTGQKGLVVLHIATALLKSPLKFEQATNAEYFPHIYGKINTYAVVGVEPI